MNVDILIVWWQECVTLITASAVVGSAGIGVAFGAFAAQFDAVPRRAAHVLAGLSGAFGTAFLVTLTLTRIFDEDYPGQGALRTMGTLGLWWLAVLCSLLGDVLARRWDAWRERRRRERR